MFNARQAHRLLPPNATDLERALSAAAALEHRPEVIATLEDGSRCPVGLLPWLAWALSVDEWDVDWTEAQQRDAILTAVQLHRKKGTPWAVLRALAVHGFDDCEIIEYAAYLQEWQASGGKYLDGSWKLDGQFLAPNVIGARDIVRGAALRHWAHYAIRVNSADRPWSRDQQQRLAAVAQRYAPARSHLVALIDVLRGQFIVTPQLGAMAQELRVRFSGCSRIRVARHETLDGCWLLDADKHTQVLDGTWRLQGAALRTTYGTEPALSDGQLRFKHRLRLRQSFTACGTQRDSLRMLGGWGFRALDDSWKLGMPHTSGSWKLQGRLRLGDGQLDMLAAHRLDGSWQLGTSGLGQSTVWMHGRITTRRKGFSVTEVL